MKTMTLTFLISAALLLTGVQRSICGTVPAGTVLTIRTLHAVSSVDVPGTPLPAELQRAVMVNGKVALPAGTHLNGKIITSRRLTHSKDQLTVDFTSIHLAGRNISITTRGPQILSNNINTKRDVPVSRASYTVASGKLMQFELARPLVF